MYEGVSAPLRRTLKLALVLLVLAAPATYLIQLLSGAPAWTTYKQIVLHLKNWTLAWGDWVLIAYLSYRLLMNRQFLYSAAEEMRLRQFEFDLARWERTPFVSPYLLWCLVSAPGSISPYRADDVYNRFYQHVTNAFRGKVYFVQQVQSNEPSAKPSVWKVAGLRTLSLLAGAYILLGAYLYLIHLNNPTSTWFTGLDRFSIPVAVFLVSVIAQLQIAIWKYARPAYISNQIQPYFGTENPQIPWRELFPDRQTGQDIIHVWQHAIERKQRETLLHENKPVPAQMMEVHYTNPALAPFPYPSMEIPEWAHQYEDAVTDFVERHTAIEEEKKWNAIEKTKKQTHGKVVEFGSKKRLR